MTNIRTGDRVRVVAEYDNSFGRHAGKLGTVRAVDPNDGSLPYLVALDGEEPDWVFSVERVGPRDIKVGDRVRITVDVPNAPATEITGAVGTVTKLDATDDRYPYRVLRDGRMADVWVHDVEPLVDEEPAKEPLESSARELTRADFLRQARELLDGTPFTANDLILLADDLQGENC